jgi:hypothetical protein
MPGYVEHLSPAGIWQPTWCSAGLLQPKHKAYRDSSEEHLGKAVENIKGTQVGRAIEPGLPVW